ncbi:MAG TPA: DUF2225 domain-containing protein [bacterium]|nr:DUF2225 domain-containing protein [bacterium]
MAPDPVWLKELKCPVCDFVFRGPRLRPTSLKVKYGEPDFHRVYEGPNPLFYAVTACPSCNYAARNEDFEKLAPEYHPEIVKLALAIRDAGKNLSFPQEQEMTLELAVKKHLLAISFYKHHKPENPNTVSGLYMHIAWMYREISNAEKEKEYLRHALEYYIKTYEKGAFIPEKIGVPGIMYLIGELNRMLGNNAEAVKWFSQVVKHDLIGNYPNIENLSRDAWEKITEEKRKNQGMPGTASSAQ